ncbi:type III-B CRISPR module RAMP protein Cmr6 [Candidatus Contubernalis alkaliaceticus]|uniref:type III-B CRISPR module RAMP protein Cmr6 n=1 Tax=Candidatus Contubernalis alkaliaceticus TaxID=338645 RepID=UPI001F4BE151|nr:type III-B CRISPR module RAMP protein Cmr6 [Candidatus Contubernalis alkalaceticus]UNC93163.1 type III-B CRISPR module RAMP protein Cmr6 [Candidatus Contubernalis alkalaceticus]
MFYHPKDTRDIYENNHNKIDQLWYRVHYFQQNSLQKDSDKRLVKLNKKISLSSRAKLILEEILSVKQFIASKYSSCHEFKIYEGRLQNKMVHGMGSAHVRETSITLHPLYGIPYIPASSIKGIVRNWVIQAYFNGKEDFLIIEEDHLSEDQKQVKILFIDLFGTEESRGAICFYDAFVEQNVQLVPDVLTVHFKDYYKGEAPPGDDQSTLPLSFYVIENNSFEFVLSVTKGCLKTKHSGLLPSQLAEVAGVWLEKALTEQGVGSKTSSGYGLFSSFEDITSQRLEEYQQQANKINHNKEKNEREAQKKAQEEQLKAKKAEMSSSDYLAFKIKNLGDDNESQALSKDEIYKNVLSFVENCEVTPAKALKEYWQRVGSWEVKKTKKKQQIKVSKIESILNGED